MDPEGEKEPPYRSRRKERRARMTHTSIFVPIAPKTPPSAGSDDSSQAKKKKPPPKTASGAKGRKRGKYKKHPCLSILKADLTDDLVSKLTRSRTYPSRAAPQRGRYRCNKCKGLLGADHDCPFISAHVSDLEKYWDELPESVKHMVEGSKAQCESPPTFEEIRKVSEAEKSLLTELAKETDTHVPDRPDAPGFMP